MTALIGILMFLSIWLPVIVAVCIAYEPTAQADRKGTLRDRRVLLSGGMALLEEIVLQYVFGRGSGSLRALIGMFRGRTTCQSLADWCLTLLICLPLAALTGCAVRYAFSAKRRGRRAWDPINRRRKAVLTLLTVCAAIPLILGAFFAMNGTTQLRIQEICRSQTVIDAEHGKTDVGYIILRNNGLLPCETGGMVLASDPDHAPYALASKTIAPGDTERFQAEKDRFVDIKKSGGTTVQLLSESGAELDAVSLAEMPDELAYRRTKRGWETYLTAADAQTAAAAQIPSPVFSALGGFYNDAFSLELSAPEGCEICYTLDGSVPTADSERYTAPIRVYDRSAEPNRFRAIQNVQADYLNKDPIGKKTVDKAFVVRAAAFDSDGNRSPIVTETYFVGLSDYSGKTVVSLVADPQDLFGDNGIYVTGADYDAWYTAHQQGGDESKAPTPNYLQRGEAWERAGNFEYYSAGTQALNQAVGLRIQGNSSRNAVLKRFSIFSRSRYSGSRLFAAPIFDDTYSHSLVLRGGFDNAFSNELAFGRDVAAVRSIPVVVFLNGEFWYETFLQEKYSASYFSETYGLAKDDVRWIKIGSWNNLSAEDKTAYQELLNKVSRLDLTDADGYDALNQVVDIQSYIDYISINLYLGNCDSGEKTNTCVWRTKTNEFTPYGDGRWRWALQDMDLVHKLTVKNNGYARSAEINTFMVSADENAGYKPLLADSVLWEALMESPVFRQQFTLTFMDLVNTTFAPDHVSTMLQTWGKDLSYDDDFYRDRAEYITKYMEQALNLSGTQETLTISAEHPEYGTVRLNTIAPDLTAGDWSGRYYTDYAVTLTALPAPGHRFVAWEVNGERRTDPTIETEILKGGSTVHVIFE